MPALAISYLYEDLPNGYIVQAEDWDTAMLLIKNAINNHALILNQGISRTTINITSGTDWVQGTDGYRYAIPGNAHVAGSKPIIRINDNLGNECHNLIESISEEGLITLLAPVPLTLEVLIL